MLKLLSVSLLFGFVLSDDCSGTAQTCSDSSNNCMKRGAKIDSLNPSDPFGDPLTAESTKYACEAKDFCEILGTNGECQKVSTQVTVPYYQYDATSNAGDVCITNGALPFRPPITLELALDCCDASTSAASYPDCTSEFASVTASQTDTTICPIDTDLSETVNKLFTCYVSDDILAYVQCNPTVYKSECTDTLQTHIATTYPECACEVLYNQLGSDGYAYIATVSGWIQGYVASMGDYFAQCGDVTLNCEGLVPDCKYNDNYDYDDCSDTIPDQGGIIKANVVLNVCILDKTFKRSAIWKILKKAFQIKANGYGASVTLQIYMENYKIGKGQAGKNGNSKKKGCSLDFDIEIAAALKYDDFDTLLDIYKFLNGLTDFDIEYAAQCLDLSIDDDDIISAEGFGDAQVESAELKLYYEDGTEYVEVGTHSLASYYSFTLIFAFLFAMIVFN